ncbi:MAG: GNAT family N-acetyltransferase [Candidatus Omnitrophica bacterium]|nr:GNAT family N-acetyltransferase [Candidatus Omnitrophota bacterium]
MNKITYKIYDNIDRIAEKDWEVVFGDIPESYPFYKALAGSELPGFSFYYLVIYSEDEIALIAPLFTADFNLDIAVEGIVAGAIKLIRKVFPRFLISKTLFCGSPFAECGALGIRQDFQDKPELILVLGRQIKDLAAKLNAPLMIIKDFPEEKTALLDVLLRQGFSRAKSFPAVLVDVNFRSFEEYLKSLGSSTRKNLNKKLKQAGSLGNVEVRAAGDIKGELAQVIKLYENTYRQGTTRFEHLNEKFFLRIAEEMPSQTRFFLYYCDGKLAAFNLCFVYKDLLIDKFIGFDYDICSRYNLYFVSWAHNIKWCIENSLRYYYPGQTDYQLKLRLGGRLIPLFAYLKHRNYFFNLTLNLLIALLKPDNFDEDIRE